MSQEDELPFYVKVQLPLAYTPLLDYRIPSGMKVKEGHLVLVPFRKQEVIGVVWKAPSSTPSPSIPQEKIKSLLRIIHAEFPLSSSFRHWLQWVADYTLSPIGGVVKLALPDNSILLSPTHTYYRWSGKMPDRMTPERSRIIALFQQSPQARTLNQLASEASIGVSVIRKLHEQAVLLREERSEPPVGFHHHLTPHLLSLSESQQIAADALNEWILQHHHQVILLEGVTGSGKTEVYASSMVKVLKEPGYQVLLLLPEIALTAQLIDRLAARLGFRPAEWHSSLSLREKRSIWQGVLNGTVRAIVGARSALFLPFHKLGLIVIDEEHESSFKQEEQIIYHGRDMAIVRGKIESLPVLLASATPSLETIYNVQIGKYKHLLLPSRFAEAVLPSVEVLDMRKEGPEKGYWLAPRLKQMIADTLRKEQQVLLYLNRRGYAPLTICANCGHRLMCKYCQTWLVEHRSKQRVECHHCGYSLPTPTHCPACHKEGSLIPYGPGVERIAEEVSHAFPQARTLIATRDTLTTLQEAAEFVKKMLDKKVDILIGTQLIAKGYHFPDLTLVGVIDADLGLSGGDLRASERTYQLLHQVSGRAGRSKSPGRVILQSYMPQNPVICALAEGNREEFFTQELEIRRQLHMPPFARLVAIIISSPKEEAAKMAAELLARTAPHVTGFTVLGPVPAPLYQLRKQFRYRLLIQADRKLPIQRILQDWVFSLPKASHIRIRIDIDPYHFY